MKIIKHLLSHIGLIVVISCVVAVIYFRSELFPNYINEPVDTAFIEIGDKLGIEIPSYKSGVDHSINSENYQIAEINEVEQTPVVDVAPENNVPNESSPDTDSDVSMVTVITESVTQTVNDLFSSDEDDINKDENNSQISDLQDETSQQETVLSKKDDSGGVMSVINNMTEAVVNTFSEPTDTAATTNDMEMSDSRQILIKARKAFWHGDLKASEKSYKELVEHEELDPNAYGELGNVYYAQGKWQEAGKAYYEAAVRLIELKQPYQVNYLFRVIQGLDAESAEKLKQKMSG